MVSARAGTVKAWVGGWHRWPLPIASPRGRARIDSTKGEVTGNAGFTGETHITSETHVT